MITVSDCATILETLYSAEDPIYHRGTETTPVDLSYGEHAEKNGARIRIWFYAMRRRGSAYGMVKGTLRDMIMDRLGSPDPGLASVSKAEEKRARYSTEARNERQMRQRLPGA